MNAVVKASSVAVVPVLTPRTFEQLVTFADLAAQSGMVPRDFINKPGAIMVACQMGSELGLSPMQSVNSIAVIGGRPGVFGDALIGICRQSPLCQDIVETISGEGDGRTAVCVATRRGASPVTSRFSVADAKRAGLWGKTGPWTQYPDRMLQHRARGWALRDAFPDLLRGLKTVEELRDIPPDTFRGTTVEHKAPTNGEVLMGVTRAAANAQAEEAPTSRDEINAAVPMTKPTPKPEPKPEPKRTVGDFLADLQGMLSAADTADQVDAIAALPRVQTALLALEGEPLDRLNKMVADALERCMPGARPEYDATSSDDVPFPGDVPLSAA